MIVIQDEVWKSLIKVIVFLILVIAGWAGTTIIATETRVTNLEKTQISIESDVKAIRDNVDLWIKFTGITPADVAPKTQEQK